MNADTLLMMALARLPGMTPDIAMRLQQMPGGLDAFFSADERTLAAQLGSQARMLDGDVRRRALEDARREALFVERKGIRVLTHDMEQYPPLLRAANEHPVALYTLGADILNATYPVAIVGTRRATAYGLEMARRIVKELAEQLPAKPLIISGLAYGIDIAAHLAALDNNCPTVAILAHGLNTIYPAAHRQHAISMLRSGGALATEYTSTEDTHRVNFLQRNHIVAGLARLVIVVESDERGGSMATARRAAEYGRTIYALPGRLTDRYSRGCNALIAKNTAALYTDTESMLEDIGWKEDVPRQPSLFPDITPEGQRVMDLLEKADRLTVTQIEERTGIPAAALHTILLDLEYDNRIARLPGGIYTNL